ncbi:hypothetical protein UFOVP1670_8 [uncultured Caudovirales phage]|uniref:Uncharacterized protein n=1 Tax=uncultured Caudovirales phage TaxID=2100421 RepID=A0A6J5T642_9CAUD|nr:hypothetical protein UFOVP1670_8 [uncultured Caudovirales phage]
MPKRKRPSKPSPKPAAKPKLPEGRQPFVATDQQRNLVKTLAGYRIAQDQMALLVINPRTKAPISETTLKKIFHAELQTGYATLQVRIMAATVRNALGITEEGPDGQVKVVQQGNVTAQIWLQKTLYGAREKTDVELPPASTPDGKDTTLDDARRVAFTLALGAQMATDKATKKAG